MYSWLGLVMGAIMIYLGMVWAHIAVTFAITNQNELNFCKNEITDDRSGQETWVKWMDLRQLLAWNE
eukprot:gene24781-10705_t